MKPLNQALITRAYLRFLGYFGVLLLGLLAVVYSYYGTVKKQVEAVATQRAAYDQTLFQQRTFKQCMDTIYTDLGDIDQLMLQEGLSPTQELALAEKLARKENLVLTRTTSLDARLGKHQKLQANEVYRRLAGRVRGLLLLKDSVARTAQQVRRLRRELNECTHPSLLLPLAPLPQAR